MRKEPKTWICRICRLLLWPSDWLAQCCHCAMKKGPIPHRLHLLLLPLIAESQDDSALMSSSPVVVSRCAVLLRPVAVLLDQARSGVRRGHGVMGGLPILPCGSWTAGVMRMNAMWGRVVGVGPKGAAAVGAMWGRVVAGSIGGVVLIESSVKTSVGFIKAAVKGQAAAWC